MHNSCILLHLYDTSVNQMRRVVMFGESKPTPSFSTALNTNCFHILALNVAGGVADIIFVNMKLSANLNNTGLVQYNVKLPV